jgi:hypothetical protein
MGSSSRAGDPEKPLLNIQDTIEQAKEQANSQYADHPELIGSVNSSALVGTNPEPLLRIAPHPPRITIKDSRNSVFAQF